MLGVGLVRQQRVAPSTDVVVLGRNAIALDPASILGCACTTWTDAQLRRYLQHEQLRRSSGGMGQYELERQRAAEKLRAKRKAPRVRRTKGHRRGLTTPGDDYRESIDHPMRAAVLELPPVPQLEPTSLVGQAQRDAWCIKTAGLLEDFIMSCCDFDSWSAANVRNVFVPVRIPADWDGVSNVPVSYMGISYSADVSGHEPGGATVLPIRLPTHISSNNGSTSGGEGGGSGGTPSASSLDLDNVDNWNAFANDCTFIVQNAIGQTHDQRMIWRRNPETLSGA
jgi:hypothetical protein